MPRKQPTYLPSKEEIEERIKQLVFLRDSGLADKIIESVMHHNKPSFEEVVDELNSNMFSIAQENLFQKVES